MAQRASTRWGQAPPASAKLTKLSKTIFFMKVLTGYDDIAPRQLYKAPVKFKPQCTWTVQCNEDMPKFSKLDGGVVRRIEVFLYPFKFCHKPDPDMPHEKPIDESIRDYKIHSLQWKQQFMRILVDRYLRCVKPNINMTPPPEVSKASDEYKDENNPVKAWMRMALELTGDRDDVIKPASLWERYQDDTPRDERIGGSKRFYQALIMNGLKKTGEGRLLCYWGLKFRTEADVDEE